MKLTRKRSHIMYAFSFLITSFIIISLYNIISLILDPYNVVWRINNYEMGNQPRFSKIEYLRNHPTENHGFIIGNSRGFFVNSQFLTRLSHIKFYNLSMLADTMYGYRDKINWLLKTQDVKHIVLLLSFDQFGMSDSRYTNILTREHPIISGESWLTYYFAFSNIPNTAFKKSLADFLQLGQRIQFKKPSQKIEALPIQEENHNYLITGDIYNNGIPQWIGMARKNRDKEFGSSKKAKEIDNFLKNYLNSPPQTGEFSSFHEIVSELDEHHIAKTCIVVPLPARTLKLVNQNRYTQWLSFLVQECDHVWDFSDANSITKNKNNYLEWSHYNQFVGDLMFERIMNIPSIELTKHPDFGHLINKKSLPNYLKAWRKSFKVNKLGT